MTESREASITAKAQPDVGRALLRMARPYRWQFVVVALLALLGTAADLIEPLIYRAVVNDIAGLFVEGGDIALQRSAEATAQESASAEEDVADSSGAEAGILDAPSKPELHRRGQVSARTAAQTLSTLLWAVGILLALNIVSHGFQLMADHRTTVLASRIEQDIIVNTFTHALRLPVAYFSRRSSGALTKQIDQLDQVSPIITAFAHQLAPEVIRLAGIFIIMLTQSWKLTLLALITLPPYLLIVRHSAKRLESGLEGYYEMWEGITSRIQDALGAIKTVKLSGAEPRESERLRGQAGAAFKQYVDRNKLANRYLLWQNCLTYLSQAIVLGYGGFLVLKHQLTPGDVVMFVAYLDKLYSPIDELSSLSVSLQQHFASLRRALRLLGTEGAETGGEPLKPGPGQIEFRHVNFAYSPGRPVLHDISFSLNPGSVTALVGPSGAGKTTLADMLLKLYQPTQGQILIDGQTLAPLDSSSVRAAIGVVAADGAIFHGSIADNIRYKRPEASDEDVRAAALAAGMSSTLARLPEGLATEVGERGVGLSVGERQRVQIARVLAGHPRVLVLDEATANLDYATENDIRRALLQRQNRPTTLVIAHRYSMVKDADHVIVLEAGRLVDQGTPEELAAKGGWFARFASGADDEDDAPSGEAKEVREGGDDDDAAESEDEDDESEDEGTGTKP